MTPIQSAITVTASSSVMTAFPAELYADLSAVADLIHSSTTIHSGLPVVVQGEHLNIPYRIYQDCNETLFECLSETQATIYSCMLTRHHDGHVRQHQIVRLISSLQPWVIPFIFQLCGEYVIEILDTIETYMPSLDERAYRAFIQENPVFYQKTRDRMISYWDCYYRWRYKRKTDYVGYRLFDRFREWHLLAE